MAGAWQSERAILVAFPFPSRARHSRSWRLPLFMSTETQRTLADGSHSSEMEVKKSRFIGYAKHAENWDESQKYIHEIKALHPKARHWCYGACFGINPVSERCSDDGEPTGTAGQPILNAVNREDLSDVVCVVVRYFGRLNRSYHLAIFD
jgi:putative IMPACT (imprinted ancient) family translation regulator